LTEASEFAEERPGETSRLAYMYHPRSFPTLSLVEAAKGVASLLWVVDESSGDVSSMSTLLRRLGTVIDITGLSRDASAEKIHKFRPDGILSSADSLLERTAEIAQRLRLPFLSTTSARILTDKFAQKTALQDAGIEVPLVSLISVQHSDDEIEEVILRATFPSVLKPRHGESSRDTYFVESAEYLRHCVNELRRARTGPRDEYVLESFIPDGEDGVAGVGFAGYVSVESVVSHDVISHVAVTGRTPLAKPFRETSAFIPSELTDRDQALVLELASRAVRALQVSIGCVHTEIKLTPDGPRVIEVNGRIGGHVPETLAAATGVNILPIAMRIALGEHVVFETLPETSKLGYVLHYYAPKDATSIISVSGLAALRERPGVDSVVLNRGPGHAVDWREGSFGHVFAVHGAGKDHDELRQLLEFVATTVRIETD
jgi:biotin carboxylase